MCLAIVGLFPIIVETMWDLPSRFRFVQPSEMLAIVAGFTLLLPMPGFVLRLIGFDIVTRECSKAGRQESDSSPRFVVSLVQVVVWFAAFVSIITTVTSDIWMLWLWTMLLAAIAPGAAWAMLSRRRIAFRLAAFLSFVAGFGFLLSRAEDENDYRVSSLLRVVIAAAVPLAVLALYRRLGYRFVRIGWRRSPTTTRQLGDEIQDALHLSIPGGHCETMTDAGISTTAGSSSERQPTNPSPNNSNDASSVPACSRWSNKGSGVVTSVPPLVILLIGAIATVDVVAIQIVRRSWTETPRHAAGETLLQILLVSQAGLLGVWAGLGSTRALIRFPVALVGLILAVGGGILAAPPGPADRWFTTLVGCCGMALTVALALLATRLFGLRLARAAEQACAGVELGRRFQFSILEALIATAEVAIFAAVLKFAYQAAEAQQSGRILELILQGAVLGLFVLLAVWIAFGRRGKRTASCCRRPAVGSRLGNLARAVRRLILYLWAVILLMSTITGPLAVFRVCGHRFERTKRGRGMIAR